MMTLQLLITPDGVLSGLICVVLLVALMLILNAFLRYKASQARIKERFETFCMRRRIARRGWPCKWCENWQPGQRSEDGFCSDACFDSYYQEIAG